MKVIVCHAVLFDLDGVLVDSTPCVERHWGNWAHKHGRDAAEILRFSHGRTTIETIRLIAPELDAAAEAAALAAIGESDLEGVEVMPGASELLASLPKELWAVVTSGPRLIARKRLVHCGLPIPNVFITADDIRRGKPAPDGYLAAAAALHCRPENCVVIEDAPSGIEAAHAAGMRVIAVATTFNSVQLPVADAAVNSVSAIRAQLRNGEIEILVSDI